MTGSTVPFTLCSLHIISYHFILYHALCHLSVPPAAFLACPAILSASSCSFSQSLFSSFSPRCHPAVSPIPSSFPYRTVHPFRLSEAVFLLASLDLLFRVIVCANTSACPSTPVFCTLPAWCGVVWCGVVSCSVIECRGVSVTMDHTYLQPIRCEDSAG